MKSIANQYKDLKEGKMSQANFMRNLRMSMPQVTNVMSFGDAVKVLKNKGIITESFDITEKENNEYSIPEVAIEEPNEDAEFDAMLKQIEDEMAGEEAVKGQYDETLNEAKETTNPNKVHPQEYTMGIKYELKCFKGDVVKAERAVLKNLAKEPFYYTALKLAGKDTYKEKATKPEVTAKKKKATKPELVDKVNGMVKVKMPKTVKEAMEVDPAGNLKPQLPTSADTERLLKYLKNNTTFVGMLKNIDNVTELIQFYRELLQLTDPELQSMSDTQLQSIFRKAVLDFRKETGVPNQIFSKNANIQKGINNIGGIKEADAPQDDKVEAELASALSQQPTLKRILQKVDLPQEVNGTVKAILDRTNLKNIPDQIILAALRKVLNDQPGPSFTSQYAINKNVGKPLPDLKEKLTALVREMLAEEAPSKKTAASEITAKAVDYIDDYNEGEKTYKKSQLENVFDSYEDKVGRRFDDSVFEDVIDMLKAKGYTMDMKETFDGRDNLDA
jgi:hypothetical protein